MMPLDLRLSTLSAATSLPLSLGLCGKVVVRVDLFMRTWTGDMPVATRGVFLYFQKGLVCISTSSCLEGGFGCTLTTDTKRSWCTVTRRMFCTVRNPSIGLCLTGTTSKMSSHVW